MATRSAERPKTPSKRKSKEPPAKRGAATTADKRPPARKRRPAATTASGRKRLAVVYDIDGPRVRLGVLWFVAVGIALAVGPIGVALVYGTAAVAAAAQSARCWRASKQVKARPHVIAAASFAGAIPLAAALGPVAAGIVVLALPVGSLVACGLGQRSLGSTLEDVGYTIQVSLFPGLAAASVVLLRDLRLGAALLVVLIASAYECGDFLVGTGSPNSFEGPIAGVAAALVVTFSFAALQVAPFDLGSAFAFGALAALLAPPGQLFASMLLPRAWSRAPALRRLDSLLLVGPVVYVLVDLVVI